MVMDIQILVVRESNFCRSLQYQGIGNLSLSDDLELRGGGWALDFVSRNSITMKK